MKYQYEEVPLKNEESVLPVYGVSGPQYAFAGATGQRYQAVRLDDNSAYVAVRMKWRDEKSVNPFLAED